jgi:hypothetical protein
MMTLNDLSSKHALGLTHAVRGEHDDLVFLESSDGIPHLKA